MGLKWKYFVLRSLQKAKDDAESAAEGPEREQIIRF